MVVQRTAFSTVQNDDPSKRLVTDASTFEKLIRFLETRKVLVFDYETSGTAWHRHAEACGVGLGSWDDAGRLWAAYVPFAHRGTSRQLDRNVVVPALLGLLRNPNTIKIAHNIKFEDHFTRKLGGVVAGPRYDTMIAARLYDENYEMGLEKRAARDLGRRDAFDQKKMVDAEVMRLAKTNRMRIKAYKSKFGYSELNPELCGFYGCTDIHHTGGLYSFYETWGLSSRYPRIWPTEMALTEVLADMEQNGLPVNVEYLHGLRETLARELEHIEGQMRQVLGQAMIEPGNDNQVRWLLTKALHIPLTVKTKGSRDTAKELESVQADVLEGFAHMHPAIQMILDWREAEKLLNTYTLSILDKCDDNNVVHGDLQQVGTNTGRLSCREPNYQNMPSESERRSVAATGKKLEEGGKDPWSIRRAFIVPQNDSRRRRVRLYFDYSQIELRVLAWYSRDPIMTDAFLKGEDIHKRTAMEVFETYDKDVRRKAKVINFGLSYCLTDKGFARQAGIPLAEATVFLDKFFARYRGIKDFRINFWAGIRGNPEHAFNNVFGRTRRLPNIVDPVKWIRERAERQAIGTLIQGTAAELTKESLVRVSQWAKANQVPLDLVNTVHDEIQMDTWEDCLPLVVPNVKRMMEAYPEFQPIPVITDCEASVTTWADKEELKAA